jgi:hypothetical protein
VLAVPQVRVVARWISSRYFCAGVRIAAGIWNLILGFLLLSHGYRWGSALFAVSALIFCAAYVLARGKSGSRGNGQG